MTATSALYDRGVRMSCPSVAPPTVSIRQKLQTVNRLEVVRTQRSFRRDSRKRVSRQSKCSINKLVPVLQFNSTSCRLLYKDTLAKPLLKLKKKKKNYNTALNQKHKLSERPQIKNHQLRVLQEDNDRRQTDISVHFEEY